jgi:Luciferase-like monooxygenase
MSGLTGTVDRPDTHDPFVATGAATVVTKTIKLGTRVCLVVQRDPIHTAKEVATVDRLHRRRQAGDATAVPQEPVQSIAQEAARRTITFNYRPSGDCLSTEGEFLPSPDMIAGALQWHCRGQRFDPVWLQGVSPKWLALIFPG